MTAADALASGTASQGGSGETVRTQMERRLTEQAPVAACKQVA